MPFHAVVKAMPLKWPEEKLNDAAFENLLKNSGKCGKKRNAAEAFQDDAEVAEGARAPTKREMPHVREVIRERARQLKAK